MRDWHTVLMLLVRPNLQLLKMYRHLTVRGKRSSLLFEHEVVDVRWLRIARKHISGSSHLLCSKGIFWSKLQCFKREKKVTEITA